MNSHPLNPGPLSKQLKTIVCLALAALLALALPFAASAAGAAPNPAQDLQAKKDKWVADYTDLVTRHAQLEADLNQARNDYSRGRSSKNLRGEGKAGLVKEIQRLEEEFAAADQELKDFPDKARRDGAFPGWFRDIEPPALAPPAAAAEVTATSAPARSTPAHSAPAHAAPAHADPAHADSEGAAADDGSAEPMSRADERAARRKSRRLGDD